MTINISTQARNNAGDAIVDLIDTGTAMAAGYIEIRDGVKPSNPQAPASGNLLSTLTLSYPAFRAFSNGQAFSNAITDDTNVAKSGIATWFRIYNKGQIAVMDGDITETGGGGDIEFDNNHFVKGGTITITSLLAVMPM